MTAINSGLTAQSVVAQRKDLLSARVDQEFVLLDPGVNAYLTLNDIGTTIWDLVETPVRVQDLCDTLVNTFVVQPDACLADLLVYLEDLHRRGLVTVVHE